MKQLSRLVDELLDISRITEGRIALEKKPIALAEIIERAVEMSEPLFQDKGQHFTVRAAPDPVYIEGDSMRLVQVVSNLLNNASRFTRDGGHIALSTEAHDAEAVVKVTDDGRGIPGTVLPHVFDLFFQGDKAYAHRYGGLGIGLTLAQRIVALHGGQIEAKSEGEGKGSEFIVRLPRLARPPQTDPGSESQDAQQSPVAARRVLIIDDNADAATMLQMLLQMRGHEARCVFDGRSGLDIASEFKPHLVLLDIAMPGMDGYEVIRYLRKRIDPQPRIIAVSGFGPDTERERLKQAGFDGHLVKPVDPDAFAALVASLR
jgi:CheY-like chemotaxis protein/two-component sensor histidine kinase